MKKTVVSRVLLLTASAILFACTNSLDSRIEKGMKKYQALPASQKVKCIDYQAIANNIMISKASGHNLAETKTALQTGDLVPQDLKLSAAKIADLIYAKDFSGGDALILGQVVCAEDLK